MANQLATLSSINVYNVSTISFLTYLKGDGSEAQIRANTRHFYELCKELGGIFIFYAHSTSDITVAQQTYIVSEIASLGGTFETFSSAIAKIKADHSTADNITYTKTYADISDFHLQSSSPAIDAGTNVGLTSDYDGVSVPRGAGYEIGAYEYPVPIAPTIGAPSALSFSSIRWNFTDNATDETGFRLYGSTGAVLVQSPLTNLLYLDETGLSANTSYSGRYVKAYNSYGESAASGIASSITTPGMPGGGPMGLIGISPTTANLGLPTTQTAPPTVPSPAPTPQSSIPTTPAITPLFTQTLKYGSRGSKVILLQDTLKQLSLFPQSVKSNGNFGPTTRQAVKRFQCQYNIVCSGNERTTGYGQVGPKTRQALNQLNH